MSDGLIDPDAFLPGSKHLRPMAVRESAGHLRSLGTAVMARTTVVAAAWTGLGGCYQAPEREKVLSLMNPVATAGWDMATATGAAASALEAYAEELDPIRQDMKSLEGRAREFRDRVKNGVKTSVVGEVPGGGWGWVLSPGLKAAEAVTSDWVTVPWTEHGPSVTENNGLVDEYNTLLGRVEQAVNTCAAAVNQLAYTVLRAQSEAYGAFGALFSGSAEPPAWGYRREEDRNIIEQVYKGVWYDAVGGLASGGAALFGRDPVTGKWGSGGTAKQAWCGLGDMVGSLLVVTNPVAAPFASMGAVEDRTGWDLPGGPVTDWAGDRMKVVSDAGGSLIGYDPGVADAGGDGWHVWKDEPWRALSSSAVNVGTFFVPVAGGVGSGAKGASAAGKVAGGARAAAELVAPGASWVVRGTELLTHGGGALARTGSWSAAVEAVRAASGGGRAGLGGVTNGVAQALADLDKVPAPVHPRPEGMPSVSESVRSTGDLPRPVLDDAAVRRGMDSWLYQDAPVEPSAAARADGAQVGDLAREPALATVGGGERPGGQGVSPGARRSDGPGPAATAGGPSGSHGPSGGPGGASSADLPSGPGSRSVDPPSTGTGASGQPSGTGRADADVPARPAGTDGPTGARGGHDGGTESPTGHGEVPGHEESPQAGRDGGAPGGADSDGVPHATDPDTGATGADGPGSDHGGADDPPRLRQDQSLSDLTSDQLAELTTAVQSRTDRELSAFCDDVYTRLDEAREQGTVTSRRKEKAFLDDKLTPAFVTVYNPHTGDFFHAINDVLGSPPADLDPRLEARINDMPDDIKHAHYETEGGLGSHAEVHAVNEALRADPTVRIEDLIVDTRRTGVNPKHPAGEGFAACPHCAYIIDGTHIVHGVAE